MLARLIAGCIGVALALTAVISPARAETTPAAPELAERTFFPLRPDDRGALIGLLQRRLTWLGTPIDATELAESRMGASTIAAVQTLQGKFAYRATDEVSKETWDTIARLAPRPGSLPKACTAGTVICVDITQRLVRLVRDGAVQLVMDARFGVGSQATRQGSFRIHQRSRDHVSSIYGMAMPYALFFSGDQAIHYSRYFARDGYAGASHGCVNVRDRAKAARLFAAAPLGTRVIVYD